ncbi:alpha-amylase family glycosyl hydrolase [Arcanobacterium hippocoleae]
MKTTISGSFMAVAALAFSGFAAVNSVPQAFASLQTCSSSSVENVSNYEGDLIYEVLVDRFYDGDPNNNNPYGKNNSYDPEHKDINRYFGGDWKGLTEKLPYLANMGVGAIWISPPYNNLDDPYLENGNYYNAYHGYWAKDYFVPDEHWGSWADFDALVSAAHQQGIKVVIDFAPNHTNHTDSVENAALYREGKLVGRYSDDIGGQGLFHHLGNRANNDSTLFDYQFKDLANLADLSTENSFVQNYLNDAIDVWLQHGVDGIRNDATLHQSQAFRTVFSDHVNGAKPVFHFGEYFISTPDSKYDDYRHSPEATGINILDFEYANVARDVFGPFTKNMHDLAGMLERTENDYWHVNDAVTWLDSHDKERLYSLQSNKGIFHTALAFLMTSRGTPVIYYGTEQYMPGPNGDAGRTWMTSFNQETEAYKLIADLAKLRKENSALRYGDTEVRWKNNDVLIFERTFGENTVVVAINRSGSNFNISGLKTSLSNGIYEDVLGGRHSGNNISVSNGDVAPFDLGPSEIGVWSSVNKSSVPLIGAVGNSVAKSGDIITIDGEGFGNVSGSVSVLGKKAKISCWSPEQVKAIVPEGVSGTGAVSVSVDGRNSNNFSFKAHSDSQVQVIFHENVQTNLGEQVYVVGDVPELGNNDPSKAIGPMFNPAYPEWFLPIAVPANRDISFKFIKKDSSGNVTWEGGSSHILHTPTVKQGAVDSPHYSWQF